MARYFYAVAALVVYGSLYPFALQSPSLGPATLAALFELNPLSSGYSDAVANFLLFIPFGLLYVDTRRSLAAFCVFLAVTFAFAFSIQVAQLAFAGRSPFGADAVINLLGAVTGWCVRLLFAVKSADQRVRDSQPEHMQQAQLFGLLGAVLLGYSLMPMVPTLDIGLVADNVKQLLDLARFNVHALLIQALTLCLLMALWRQAHPVSNHPLAILLVGLGWLAVKLLGVQSAISVNHLLAIPAVLFVRLALPWQRLQSVNLLAFTLVVFLLLTGLYPLEFHSIGSYQWGSINLIPFLPALNGNLLINSFALVEKGLLYVVLFVMGWLAGYRFVPFLCVISGIVLCVELIQTGMLHRTGDVTEVVVCVMVGLMVRRWMRERAT